MRGTITAGVIAEFIIYVNMLTWPVASLGWVTSIIQRAAASQKRINEFLKIVPEIQDQDIPHQKIEGKIKFENVEFTYPDTGIKALNGISFEVNPGDTMAIIGTTGSGKSTIANLLFRLYDVELGSIKIDDKNITQYSVSNLRSQMGYAPQEVFLFSDTITNNISFGISGNQLSKNELQEKVEKAAEDACILGSIIEFEKGFETIVGERGNTLSGGQKQRISIARTIIKNPSILVFDDCLSAVDTDTEERILRNLKRIMQDKTSIIISHRISTVKDANIILVMDAGNIIEKGNHEELIALRGSYYELFLKQQRESSLQKQ
jgi:ATP-binding cassette subfamily B protein